MSGATIALSARGQNPGGCHHSAHHSAGSNALRAQGLEEVCTPGKSSTGL